MSKKLRIMAENASGLNTVRQSEQARNIDQYAGGTGTNPWRVVKGYTGYYGLQIDNRAGLARPETRNDQT